MKIENCHIADLPTIFQLYDLAIRQQPGIFKKAWLPIDEYILTQDIEEGRQWKISEGNTIACIFTSSLQSPYVWGEAGKEAALYISRFVSNPVFKKIIYLAAMAAWAKIFARDNDLPFIRLATWEEETDDFTRCGFMFKGITSPVKAEELPKSYTGIRIKLFEMKA